MKAKQSLIQKIEAIQDKMKAKGIVPDVIIVGYEFETKLAAEYSRQKINRPYIGGSFNILKMHVERAPSLGCKAILFDSSANQLQLEHAFEVMSYEN